MMNDVILRTIGLRLCNQGTGSMCVQTHHQLIQSYGLGGMYTLVKNDRLAIFTDNKKKNMTIN